MIVADTGAVLALVDADDRHHDRIRESYERDPDAWVLPWSILAEVDHLMTSRLGPSVARTFRLDLGEGAFHVEWGKPEDLARAVEIDARYQDLDIGLVDATVMAIAERLGARAIATLDLRDFGPVQLKGAPSLWPRDL